MPADRSIPESVVAWLGDRRVLLVLDNCEEVVVAAGSGRAARAPLPRAHLLVTSRVPLGVAGEVRMPLRPLDQIAAVDLFVDRVALAGRAIDGILAEDSAGSGRGTLELAVPDAGRSHRTSWSSGWNERPRSSLTLRAS